MTIPAEMRHKPAGGERNFCPDWAAGGASVSVRAALAGGGGDGAAADHPRFHHRRSGRREAPLLPCASSAAFNSACARCSRAAALRRSLSLVAASSCRSARRSASVRWSSSDWRFIMAVERKNEAPGMKRPGRRWREPSVDLGAGLRPASSSASDERNWRRASPLFKRRTNQWRLEVAFVKHTIPTFNRSGTRAGSIAALLLLLLSTWDFGY